MAPARSVIAQVSLLSLHGQNWLRRKIPTTTTVLEEGRGGCGPCTAEGFPVEVPVGWIFRLQLGGVQLMGDWYCQLREKLNKNHAIDTINPVPQMLL